MIKIDIIGTEDSKQKMLVRNVQQAIDGLHINANIRIISNWEEIIAFRIIKIPALFVQNQVLSQGFVPNVQEIESLLASFMYDGNQLVV